MDRTNQQTRGMSQESKRQIEAMQAIVADRAPVGVRGICYPLFNVYRLIPSMEKKYTDRISRLSVVARTRGLIDWKDIVDDSREIEYATNWRDTVEYSEQIASEYRKDYWCTQPYSVQVWSEKGTVGGILRPVTEKWGGPFWAVHGFSSATTIHEVANMSAKDPRTLVILYVGDWDPSGMFMSEVDIPKRLKEYGGRAIIKRIALLAEDLPTLPPIPAKRTDSRYKWYYPRYGNEAVELDAMHPRDLRNRVEQEIQQYIDQDAWERTRVAEAAEQKSVRHVALALRYITDEANME
jgi:hypothetical protein